MQNRLRNRRGMAIFLVLFIIFVLITIVGAYHLFISGEKKGFYMEYLRERAYYIAESGYNLAVAMLLDHGFDHRWYSGPHPGYVEDAITGERLGLQHDIIHTATFEKDYNGGKFIVYIQEEPSPDSDPRNVVLKCIHIYSKGIYKNEARVIYGRIVLAPPPGYFEPYFR